MAGSIGGSDGLGTGGNDIGAGGATAGAGGGTAGVGGMAGAAGVAGPTSGAGGQDAAGDGGSDASPATASTEDDGADCSVDALPDSGSLPSISKLPDPFQKLDGSRVSTRSEWRCRRQEIKRIAETYAFGAKPPPPESVSGSVSNTSVTVEVMDGGKATSFSASVRLPSGGQAPYPAIVVYGGTLFGAPLDSTVINGEGVALINYNPYDVGKEGTPRSNKQGAFYDVYGASSPTGLLVA